MAMISGQGYAFAAIDSAAYQEVAQALEAQKKAADESRPMNPDFAYLIELGYLHKKRLLRDPMITKVDVALAGRHLVIIAYKENAS